MKKLLVIECGFLAFVIAMITLAFIWGATATTVPLAVAFGTFAGLDIGIAVFDVVLIVKTILEIKSKGE